MGRHADFILKTTKEILKDFKWRRVSCFRKRRYLQREGIGKGKKVWKQEVLIDDKEGLK